MCPQQYDEEVRNKLYSQYGLTASAQKGPERQNVQESVILLR